MLSRIQKYEKCHQTTEHLRTEYRPPNNTSLRSCWWSLSHSLKMINHPFDSFYQPRACWVKTLTENSLVQYDSTLNRLERLIKTYILVKGSDADIIEFGAIVWAKVELELNTTQTAGSWKTTSRVRWRLEPAHTAQQSTTQVMWPSHVTKQGRTGKKGRKSIKKILK